MKKIIFGSIAVVVLAIAYYLISPLFIDTRVSEEFPTATTPIQDTDPAVTEPEIIARGTFSGFDSVHYGSGDAVLIKTADGYVVRFEENFEVANGPDLFVGLGKNGEYAKEAQLARLKGNIGSQNYEIPSDINIADYNEVWVWCRAFSVPFAKAVFEPVE